MKKLFALTMLISFAMVCSCHKQSSTAEQQLAQRKAELDARDKALNEREKALDETEKALPERENVTASASTPSPDPQSQGQTEDSAQWQPPAQWDADIDKRIQQLPPEVQDLMQAQEQLATERERRLGTKRATSAAEQSERIKNDAAKKAAAASAEDTSPPQ